MLYHTLEGHEEFLTFCSASEYTSWGRMSPFTTASARSSL